MLLSKRIVGMFWEGLDQIMGGKKVKNCDLFTISIPRTSSECVGLLVIIRISKTYRNIYDGRYGSPLIREF